MLLTQKVQARARILQPIAHQKDALFSSNRARLVASLIGYFTIAGANRVAIDHPTLAHGANAGRVEIR